MAKEYIFPAYTSEVDHVVENLTQREFRILNQLSRPIQFLHNRTILFILNPVFAQDPVENQTYFTYKDTYGSDYFYLKIQINLNTIYSPFSF